MRVLTALMVFLSLTSVSLMAAAKNAPVSDRTEYTFDDDVVTGDLLRPDDAEIVVRRRGKESSLVKVRQNFIPELLQSVEDI